MQPDIKDVFNYLAADREGTKTNIKKTEVVEFLEKRSVLSFVVYLLILELSTVVFPFFI